MKAFRLQEGLLHLFLGEVTSGKPVFTGKCSIAIILFQGDMVALF
jgi:hypothetical protein